VYIGSSININERIKSHKNCLLKNKHHSIKLQNTYNKYGIEAFIYEVIEYCDNIELLSKEQEYIDLYDSYNNGYNCAKMSTNPMLNRKHSDVTKLKMSTNNRGENHHFYGKKLSEEHKRKLSIAIKNRKHSDVTKLKMSDSQKNRTDLKNNQLTTLNSRKIVQLDLKLNEIKIWNTITECANTLKLNRRCISDVLCGRQKTSGGFKFKYYENK